MKFRSALPLALGLATLACQSAPKAPRIPLTEPSGLDEVRIVSRGIE